jgi:transcription factor C subunit 7
LKKDFFPWVDDAYESLTIPDEYGERIDELHDRIALALKRLVEDVDREYQEMGRGEEEVTVLICGHAAQIICTGRALTGIVPDDYDEEDFKCFTCGISRFVRRPPREQLEEGHGKDVVEAVAWRTNGGVAGGWDCVANSDCSHLSMGEERGWHFHGDESFDSYGPGQTGGSAPGVKISDGGMMEDSDPRPSSSTAKL